MKTSVCILGAGAGGIGCAYRLIRRGINTVIIDKFPDYGGTQTFCGIDGWEPGVSLDGLHTVVADELSKMKNGCHVVEVVPNMRLLDGGDSMNWDDHSFAERPWGYDAPTDAEYDETLARCVSLRGDKSVKRFQFDGDLFIEAIHNVFSPYKEKLTELFGYRYVSAETDGGTIKALTVTNGKEDIRIEADYFVDASGDIVLARDVGCRFSFGCEGQEEYGEPSARERSESVNAVTYAFRVTPTEDKSHVDELPTDVIELDLGEWADKQMRGTVSLIVRYPDGDLHINMLPTMQGDKYFALGENADITGRARVLRYWHFLQSERGLSGYTLKRIYEAGIRESYRLVGKYVLKEQDLRRGAPDTECTTRTIAIADHSMDIHGKDGFNSALEKPYSVPIECAMTNEFDNLFVACRGASFTHIAASSVRLSRTMISFGEGVGEYIADIIEKN